MQLFRTSKWCAMIHGVELVDFATPYSSSPCNRSRPTWRATGTHFATLLGPHGELPVTHSYPSRLTWRATGTHFYPSRPTWRATGTHFYPSRLTWRATGTHFFARSGGVAEIWTKQPAEIRTAFVLQLHAAQQNDEADPDPGHPDHREHPGGPEGTRFSVFPLNFGGRALHGP